MADQRATSAAIVALVCALVAGCATTTEQLVPVLVPDEASDAQLAAIADNDITEEEYTAGFRAYAACLADAGYEIIEGDLASDPYDYGIPDAAVQSGVEERCNNTHFYVIDVFWQTLHPRVTRNDALLRECLAEADLPTDGDVNELQRRMADNGLDIQDCLGIESGE